MRVMKFGGGIVALVGVAGLAVPAQAQRWDDREYRQHHREGDRVSVADALIGGAVIGGLLAIVASEKNRRDRADAAYAEEYDTVEPATMPSDYDGTYTAELAQDRCTEEVETMAARYDRLSRITAVSSTKWDGRSWLVKGQIEFGEGHPVARSHNWRCSLTAGARPEVTFLGL